MMHTIGRFITKFWPYVAAVFIAGAFVTSATGLLPAPTVEVTWRPGSSTSNKYTPSYGDGRSKELVMVYVGSSTCGYCNDSTFPDIIDDIKVGLQQRAREREWGFSTIGVSIDWLPADGVDHLAKFGLFDEIMTGKQWHGVGAHLCCTQFPGPEGTPQVLVIARDNEGATVANETLVMRMIGRHPIDSWLTRGLPLPLDVLDGFLDTPTSPSGPR